jgi:hypothetical protein
MINPHHIFSKLIRSEKGSISLEAALILPIMLCFVLTLTSLIRIASAEVALQAAAGETAKSIASFWTPVRMVYADAKGRVMNTQAATWTQDALARVQSVRSGWTGSEDWIMQYEDLLPEPIISLLKWEIERRESLEDEAGEQVGNTVHRYTDPLLCRAFEPILQHYSNPQLLKQDNLQVESIVLPSLEPGGEPYVEITVSYTMKLQAPFFSRTIRLEHKAYERAWVGEE